MRKHPQLYKSMVYKRTKHTKINKHFFVQNMAKTHALYNHCSTLFEYTKSPSAQISCKTRFTWTFQTDLVQDKIHVNISNWSRARQDSREHFKLGWPNAGFKTVHFNVRSLVAVQTTSCRIVFVNVQRYVLLEFGGWFPVLMPETLVCVCVCVCVVWEEYNIITVYYFWRFYFYIFVDVVKRGAFTCRGDTTL